MSINGNTTGVYIPTNEYISLKNKYKGIEDEVTDTVPDWHKEKLCRKD